MASGAVAARRGVLGAALCMSSVLSPEPEPSDDDGDGGNARPRAAPTATTTTKKKETLKSRLAALEERIVREAVTREAMTHNDDEERVLESVMVALMEKEELEETRALIEERLAHVRRRHTHLEAMAREAEADDASSSDDDDDEDDEGDATDRKRVQGSVACCRQALGMEMTTAAFWADLVSSSPVGHKENDSCTRRQTCPASQPSTPEVESQLSSLHRDVASRGYFCTASRLVPERLTLEVDGIMASLRSRGLPPTFAFMYAAAWELLLNAWPCAEAVVGEECVLEPSVAAFHLAYVEPESTESGHDGHDDTRGDCGGGTARQEVGNKQRYVGTNFGVPHRDYTYSDSATASGEPRIVSVWVAVNDVSTSNGCMYVVPRSFDENFERDACYEHMQVCSVGGLKDKSFLNFPLHGVRPLPCASGCVMGWQGNLIHWGSSVQPEDAGRPRKSLAFAFRRRHDIAHQDANGGGGAGSYEGKVDHMKVLSRSTVEALACRDDTDALVQSRLARVMDALAFFKHWYDIDEALLECLRTSASVVQPNLGNDTGAD